MKINFSILSVYTFTLVIGSFLYVTPVSAAVTCDVEKTVDGVTTTVLTGAPLSGTMVTTQLPAGQYTFTAICSDSAPGSTEFSSSITVTVLSPLTVTCSASRSNVDLASNAPVTWTATASGATAPYSYRWSVGSELLGLPVNTTNPKTVTYLTAGTKTGYITATDSSTPSQSVERACTSDVVVGNSNANFDLNHSPNATMTFLGRSAASSPVRINLDTVPGFNSSVAFSASTTKVRFLNTTTGTNVDRNIGMNFYVPGTRNTKTNLLSNDTEGIDVVITAQDQIRAGTYPITIKGVGGLPLVTKEYTFNLIVNVLKPVFEEF